MDYTLYIQPESCAQRVCVGNVSVHKTPPFIYLFRASPAPLLHMHEKTKKKAFQIKKNDF